MYYYNISYNYSDYESDKTEIKSIFPDEPQNNDTPPVCAAPCHIHNFVQEFDDPI